MSNFLELEKIEPVNLPELQGLREKQLQVVEENPFVEIVDSKTYDAAKRARTNLVSARTEIEKQDKLIASKIKRFRELVAGASADLIAITKSHEDKQQEAVKSYEAAKEFERQEKARLEQQRIDAIKARIDGIYLREQAKIQKLEYGLIETLKTDWEVNLLKMDLQQFEEFADDFSNSLNQLRNQLSIKINALEKEEAARLEKLKLEAEKAELLKQQKAQEAELQRVKAEAEKIRAEQAAAEQKLAAERQAFEKQKKDLELLEQKKAREAQEQKEAEEKKAKEEAARAAQEKRAAALLPEKDKAIAWAKALKIPELPEVNDALLNDILQKFTVYHKDLVLDLITDLNDLK